MVSEPMFNMKVFEDSKLGTAPMWGEGELRNMLEYEDKDSFRRVIRKAMQTCLATDKDPEDYFHKVGGEYQMNRIGCYLVCMSADSRKKHVKLAQCYLAFLAGLIEEHHEHVDAIDRIILREEITGGMKSLAVTAKTHGARDFAAFMDAGYIGMYNMSLKDLKAYKGISVRDTLLDYMGRVELSANQFRVAMTDANIRRDDIHGQRLLEGEAMRVGKVVRKAVMEAGVAPEAIPISGHIRDAKKLLRASEQNLRQLTPDEIRFITGEKHELLEAGDDPGYIPDPEEDPPLEEDDEDDEDTVDEDEEGDDF